MNESISNAGGTHELESKKETPADRALNTSPTKKVDEQSLEVVTDDNDLAEKTKKLLSLYEKKLLDNEYDTVENLDTSLIAPERLKEIREKVFFTKLEKVTEYYPEYFLSNFTALQNHLQLSDDEAKAIFRKFYLAEESALLKFDYSWGDVQERWKNRDTREENMRKFLDELEISVSEEERAVVRKDGFLTTMKNEAPYRTLVTSTSLKKALDIYGLDESIIHSPEYRQILLDRFLEDVEKDKTTNSIHELEYFVESELFPKELLQSAENQDRLNNWFLDRCRAVSVQDEKMFVTVPKRFRYRNEDEYEESEQPYRYIERILGSYEKLGISDALFEKEEVRQVVGAYIDGYFGDTQGSVRWHTFVADEHMLKKAGFSTEALHEKARQTFKGILHSAAPNSMDRLKNIMESFPLSQDFLGSDEVVELKQSYIQAKFSSSNLHGVNNMLDTLQLPVEAIKSESFVKARQDFLLRILESDSLPNIPLLETVVQKLGFDAQDEFFADDECRGRITQNILKYFGPLEQALMGNVWNTDSNLEYMHKLENGESVPSYTSKELQPYIAAQNAARMARLFNNTDSIQDFFEFAWDVNIKPEISGNREDTSFKKVLNLSEKMLDYQHFFLIDQTTIKDLAFNYFTKNIELVVAQNVASPVQTLNEIQEKFSFNVEEMQMLAFSTFHHYTLKALHDEWGSGGDMKTAGVIADAFELPPELTRDAVEAVYASYLAKGRNEKALALKNKFALDVDSSSIESAFQKNFTDTIEDKDVGALVRQKNKGGLAKEFFLQQEINDGLVDLFYERVSDGNLDDARELATHFPLQGVKMETLANLPKVKTFFGTLKERFPKLAQKYLASIDTFLSAYSQIHGNELATLDNNSFLETALLNNERYGVKLLAKFSELDKLSKANINTLYDEKAAILAEEPNIPTDSNEFRIAMQNRLMPYRRNQEILSSLEKAGVNTTAWANYQQEAYFTLGEDDSYRFSDAVVTPIKRIRETVSRYGEIVRRVLGEYKQELAEIQVPTQKTETLQGKLLELEKQLSMSQQPNQQEKVSGLQKGIESLTKQIQLQKTTTLWNKVSDNLASVDRVKEGVFAAYDKLCVEEDNATKKEADTNLSGSTRQKILTEIKMNIGAAKKDLKDKLALLEKRMDEFQKSIFSMLAPSLGTERTEAMIQEIESEIAEGLDHYQSDKTTLANLFSEKEKEGVVGRPMRIGLWSRDPDRDLYLGNYTDCCIRIDSDHMGSESTIADYMTDMGMQIVDVYDQKSEIPVVSAWCWIGHDDEDTKAFIIDNIEANTDYSSEHRKQLESELMKYIVGYATRVGLDNIYQGRQNNDLTLPLRSTSSRYFKLGGYNRPSGYFLEAEDDDFLQDNEWDYDEMAEWYEVADYEELY